MATNRGRAIRFLLSVLFAAAIALIVSRAWASEAPQTAGTPMAIRSTAGSVVVSVDWAADAPAPTYTVYRDPKAPVDVIQHYRAGERFFEVTWPASQGEPTVVWYSDGVLGR